MRNHVHLVMETLQANLGQFMHKVETGYTIYYNKRHRESGHLMQGRYGAKTVEGDDYLLALARYVHLNPKHIFSLLDPTQSVAWVAEREDFPKTLLEFEERFSTAAAEQTKYVREPKH